MLILQYFKEVILPQIIKSQNFEDEPKVVNVKNSSDVKEEFMSSVLFVDVELQFGENSEKISLFCKFENESTKEMKREHFQTHLQFFNEVLLYKELILSYPTSVSDIFPKFYFGTATSDGSSETSVIVLENLITKGFEGSRNKVFLDFDHCSLAFEKLGEYHGASLKMKMENPSKFEGKMNQLCETKWMSHNRERQNYFYKETTSRGVIPLLKNAEENVDSLNVFLDRLKNVHSVIGNILEVNKHSVLCHGDFCSNNMVFKYSTSELGPVDVKLFDLGTARFASPIIDISFFLFLNTSCDLRRKHFKSDLLKIYLDGVKKYAGSAAPSMQELWEEFQKKAVYGYLLSSFFLPIMCHGERDPETDDLEEITKQNLRKGGEEVTGLLSEIVRDLVTWGCVEAFISS